MTHGHGQQSGDWLWGGIAMWENWNICDRTITKILGVGEEGGFTLLILKIPL